MTEFGEVLDDYNPVRETIYPLFTKYFDNPVLTKIKNVENYSVYMTKIHALLGIEFRYIIAFIHNDKKPIGTTAPLSSLYWETLQTRTLQDDHRIPVHTYIPHRAPYLDQKIKLIYQDDKQFKYTVEKLPLTVTLLPKTKSNLEYNREGNMISALETYQTIISFVI